MRLPKPEAIGQQPGPVTAKSLGMPVISSGSLATSTFTLWGNET